MTKNVPSVLVMMASYNGEDHIAEQIESILNQKNVNITILITDDCSQDRTACICKGIAQKDARVVYKENGANKGVTKNFLDMIYSAKEGSYDYYALSDQDDYWLSDKLDQAVILMQQRSQGPILYYSDVCNVGNDLSIEYGFDYAVFQPCAKNLKSLMIGNWASGCTMVFNNNFLELVKEYRPPELLLWHDWWLHMIALACGAIVSDLSRSFIKRRITGGNVLGRSKFGVFDQRRIRAIVRGLHEKKNHRLTTMAGYLLDGYGEYMDGITKEILHTFSGSNNSIRSRCKVVFDPEYYLPSKGETLVAHAKAALNFL